MRAVCIVLLLLSAGFVENALAIEVEQFLCLVN